MMHDCRTAQERLLDLVFHELDEREGSLLLDEIEGCALCQDQYRSMTVTLFAFDQATGAMTPGESFWPAHHERLQDRLSASTANSDSPRAPLWTQFMRASVRVPAPVAALALLLLFISSLFAFVRASGTRATESTEGSTASAAPAGGDRTRIVEVPVVRERPVVQEKIVVQEKPVVQERVVTRTVYVTGGEGGEKIQAALGLAERGREAAPANASQEARESVATAAATRMGQAAQTRQTAQTVQTAQAGQTGQMGQATQAADAAPDSIKNTHAALAGFKPAGEVKLRIIKGSYGNEK